MTTWQSRKGERLTSLSLSGRNVYPPLLAHIRAWGAHCIMPVVDTFRFPAAHSLLFTPPIGSCYYCIPRFMMNSVDHFCHLITGWFASDTHTTGSGCDGKHEEMEEIDPPASSLPLAPLTEELPRQAPRPRKPRAEGQGGSDMTCLLLTLSSPLSCMSS